MQLFEIGHSIQPQLLLQTKQQNGLSPSLFVYSFIVIKRNELKTNSILVLISYHSLKVATYYEKVVSIRPLIKVVLCN
jgi:hypothetical protein